MTTEQYEEIFTFGDTIESIDESVFSRTKQDRTMLVMSILSDAQHHPDTLIKDKLINKAKYIISKYLGGK